MNTFYDEIWFHIAGYFISLKSFARFWWSNPFLLRNGLTSDSKFWTSIIKYFCEIRDKDYMELSGRIDWRESGIYILRSVHHRKRCSHSGCYKQYTEWDNNIMQCTHHPGKLGAAGYLSCCRGKGFGSRGCKTAYHDGAVFSLIHMRRETESATEVSNIRPTLPFISSISLGTAGLPPIVLPVNKQATTRHSMERRWFAIILLPFSMVQKLNKTSSDAISHSDIWD